MAEAKPRYKTENESGPIESGSPTLSANDAERMGHPDTQLFAVHLLRSGSGGGVLNDGMDF